jgi:hypothetical protein
MLEWCEFIFIVIPLYVSFTAQEIAYMQHKYSFTEIV